MYSKGKQDKDKLSSLIEELQSNPGNKDVVGHLCGDTVVLKALLSRAALKSATDKVKPEQFALLTTTVDSHNRVRDEMSVKKSIGLERIRDWRSLMKPLITRIFMSSFWIMMMVSQVKK